MYGTSRARLTASQIAHVSFLNMLIAWSRAGCSIQGLKCKQDPLVLQQFNSSNKCIFLLNSVCKGMIPWALGYSSDTILCIKMFFLPFLVNGQRTDSPFQNDVELRVFAV